jgi:hypothetical protein
MIWNPITLNQVEILKQEDIIVELIDKSLIHN